MMNLPFAAVEVRYAVPLQQQMAKDMIHEYTYISKKSFKKKTSSFSNNTYYLI